MVDEVVKMSNKKLTVGILGGVIVLSALGYLYLNPEEEVQVQVVEEKPSSEPAPVLFAKLFYQKKFIIYIPHLIRLLLLKLKIIMK